MNAHEDIRQALEGTAPRVQRGRHPKNRKRLRTELTLAPETVDKGGRDADRLGFPSLSAYVEALLTDDSTCPQKSMTARNSAPIVRIGQAAAGALFAVRDAMAKGRELAVDLLPMLRDIRDCCAEMIRASIPAYEAELDVALRTKSSDRWGDD